MATLVTLSLATAMPGQAAQTPSEGVVEEIVVHGRSLEGNLNGDSPDRQVHVYLPPSYGSDLTRHYPTVYLLHGYGLTSGSWMRIFDIETAANRAMTDSGEGAGEPAGEMILVSASAYSIYDGSMYSSSVTAGDWESFIADDLVSFIDSHYRTLPDRMSRGLAGHSMGGYGTMRIGMKQPDVFSSIYPMSACCMLEQGNPSPAMEAAEAFTTREQVAELSYPDKGTFCTRRSLVT